MHFTSLNWFSSFLVNPKQCWNPSFAFYITCIFPHSINLIYFVPTTHHTHPIHLAMTNQLTGASSLTWNISEKFLLNEKALTHEVLTFKFVSQLPVHKALPSADKPKQLIRFSCEFWRDPKFETTCHRYNG